MIATAMLWWTVRPALREDPDASVKEGVVLASVFVDVVAYTAVGAGVIL